MSSIRCFGIMSSYLECKSLYFKWSNIEYRKQPKMLVQRTCNNPTQGNTSPQEGSKAEIVPPPNFCLKPCIGSTSIPMFLAALIQEDFGRHKDLKTLLKSLQTKKFSGKEDNVLILWKNGSLRWKTTLL